jgi:hypothetical protein
MLRQFACLMSIGILNFFLFTGVFKLLQNEKIYQNTLGLISSNYERKGSWGNYEIGKTSRAFLPVKNENFQTWDAAIYKCISEKMYSPGNDCLGNVRAAFFPLFPALWKVTHVSPIGISIINYFLFILSIALLVLFLLKTSLSNKMIAYAIMISLPSVIIFYIPYTEALFLFTMTVTAIGLLKKKYPIFFTGSFLMSMVRPATAFILIAIAFVELMNLIKNKNYRSFLKEIILKFLPFLLGYACTLFIQYLYTGSWSAMLEAQKHWAGGIKLIKGFSDWSVEGFGLSSFSIFFVCLPAILFILSLVINWRKKAIGNYLLKIKGHDTDYLFLISVFYLAGIFAFTIMTSGGNLHSFFRFTLASPFFYIAILVFLNYISDKPLKLFVIIFIILNVFLVLFLNLVDYGGQRMQFALAGLYLSMVTSTFLLIKKMISPPFQISIMVVLIILNTIWNTYLLNVFFSDGWVFT